MGTIFCYFEDEKVDIEILKSFKEIRVLLMLHNYN